MSIYGLADCNNFFASCERVFRPALEGRPAVVLSSNDGCIVARSDEAKALGVKMAQPAFQAKNLIEQHSIAVISGNLQFYTDMSTRVMQAFGELVPAVEKYSIRHVRDRCGALHSHGQSRRLVDERVHRDQPFRQEPTPRSVPLGGAVARDQ